MIKQLPVHEMPFFFFFSYQTEKEKGNYNTELKYKALWLRKKMK